MYNGDAGTEKEYKIEDLPRLCGQNFREEKKKEVV